MKKQIQIILVALSFLLFGKETFSQVFSSATYFGLFNSVAYPKTVKAIRKGTDNYTIENTRITSNLGNYSSAYLLKNGNEILRVGAVSDSPVEFRDFIVDTDGNIYVVGYMPVSGSALGVRGSFIIKVNANGGTPWLKGMPGQVTSVVSENATTLLVMTDETGPVIRRWSKSTGFRDLNPPLYQLVSGIASAGKLYTDGTRYYFTLTFDSGSIRLSSTSSLINNIGGTDAVVVNFNPTDKTINWYRHLGTPKNEQVNDVCVSEYNSDLVYFIGTTNTNGSNNDAFLIREKKIPTLYMPEYTTVLELNNASNNEGIAVNCFSDGSVYALFQTKGTVTVNGQAVVNRTNFNDLLIVGYNSFNLSFLRQASLYTAENTYAGDMLQTGTNEYMVYGSGYGDLTAKDNSGSHALVVNQAPFITFAAVMSTATCPIVASPSAISGPSNYCQGISTAFSISPVDGATSYTWTLPNGWTGSSSSPSISLVPNSASGTISVKANNACGNSSAVVTKALTAGGAPAVPTLISGPSNLCPGISATYSIDSVSGASSYVWTVPSGWTGVSTTKSITVTAGANSGNISVSSKNSCGTSGVKTLAVLANGTVPSQPSSIEGDAYICINSSRTYTVPAVAGATSYTWSLPSGFVGNSTTNSITVETSANALKGSLSVRANNGCGSGVQRFLPITVQKTLPEKVTSISGVSTGCPGLNSGFSVSSVVQGQTYQWSVSEPSFTIVENNPNSGIQLTVGNRTGTVSVVPINACGVGPETTKEVIVQVPNAPVVSSVPVSLCLNAAVSSYFTASSSGSIYEWSASSNVSPSATTSNTLLFKATSYGTDSIARFSVRSKSNCGYGDYAFVEIPIVSVPAQPSVITGTTSPARNVATPYSVEKDPLATSYQWSASSQLVVPNLNEANITFYGSGLVTINVSAVNACGSSVERSLEVTINQDNVAPIVSSLSPLNNATNVAIDANLVLTFSEPVVKVTGKMIQLVRFSGDVVVGNYTVDSPEVTISGSTLTINPSFDLETNTVYYVYMANGAVKDASNNFFTGMANSSFWKFTTMNPVGVEDDMITYEAQVQNPFSTSFTLQLPKGEVHVKIFDGKGTLVDEIITSEGVLNQLGSEWSSGLYILQITSKDVQEQLKIVKQ